MICPQARHLNLQMFDAREGDDGLLLGAGGAIELATGPLDHVDLLFKPFRIGAQRRANALKQGSEQRGTGTALHRALALKLRDARQPLFEFLADRMGRHADEAAADAEHERAGEAKQRGGEAGRHASQRGLEVFDQAAHRV